MAVNLNFLYNIVRKLKNFYLVFILIEETFIYESLG